MSFWDLTSVLCRVGSGSLEPGSGEGAEKVRGNEGCDGRLVVQRQRQSREEAGSTRC